MNSETSPAIRQAHRNEQLDHWGYIMIFYIVYSLAIVVLILHFTGWLARRNMEWAVMAAAVALFAVNILDYLKII